jgi:hypothetical protein
VLRKINSGCEQSFYARRALIHVIGTCISQITLFHVIEQKRARWQDLFAETATHAHILFADAEVTSSFLYSFHFISTAATLQWLKDTIVGMSGSIYIDKYTLFQIE